MELERIAVIGAGTMGHALALVHALGGCRVALCGFLGQTFGLQARHMLRLFVVQLLHVAFLLRQLLGAAGGSAAS